MNRKKLILLILLAILSLALFYALWATPKQQRVTSENNRNSDVVNRSDANNSLNKMVKVELLEKETTSFKGIKRDLFGELYPKPKIVKPAPLPKPVIVTPPKPIVRTPTPVEIVRRELARFTFMGYLRKQDSWTIFLSARDEIFLVKEGDYFGPNNQFHAVEITPERLVINQSTQGRIEIPLVEKQPLVPSSLPSVPVNAVSEQPTQRPTYDTAQPSGSITRPVRPFRTSPFRTPQGAPMPTTQESTPSTDTPNEVSNE